MQGLLARLLPELAEFPEPERRAALRRARDHDLDALELLGAALALVLATVASRYLLGEAHPAGRLAYFALNLLVAAPLLFAAFLPFHLRRVRRGLRAQLDRVGHR